MTAKFIQNRMVVWAVVVGCIAILILPLTAQSTSPCDLDTMTNCDVNSAQYRSDYGNNLLLEGSLLNQFQETPLKVTLFLLGSIVFYFFVYFLTKLQVYKKYCDKLFTRKVNISIFSATVLAALLPLFFEVGFWVLLFPTIGETIFLYSQNKQNHWLQNILIVIGANISFALVVTTFITVLGVVFNLYLI